MNIFVKVLKKYRLAVIVSLLAIVFICLDYYQTDKAYHNNLAAAFKNQTHALTQAINAKAESYAKTVNEIAALIAVTKFDSQAEMNEALDEFLAQLVIAQSDRSISRIILFKKVTTDNIDNEIVVQSADVYKSGDSEAINPTELSESTRWLGTYEKIMNDSNSFSSIGHVINENNAPALKSFLNEFDLNPLSTIIKPILNTTRNDKALGIFLRPVKVSLGDYLVFVTFDISTLLANFDEHYGHQHLSIGIFDNASNCRFVFNEHGVTCATYDAFALRKISYINNSFFPNAEIRVYPERDYEKFFKFENDAVKTLVYDIVFSVIIVGVLIYMTRQRFIVEAQSEQLKYSMHLNELADKELKQSTQLVTSINPGLVSNNTKLLLGYDEEDEFEYKKFFDICHPDDKEKHRDFVQKLDRYFASHGSSGEPPSLLHRLKRKQGDYIWVSLSVTKLDESSYIYFARNVNEEINNTQRLENALSAKNRFLSRMSHELRTPLNGIMGFLDVLKSNNNDKQQLTYIAYAQSASTQLLALIEDLLDAQDLANNKIKIKHDQLDLKQVLLEIEAIMKAAFRSTEVNLDVDIAAAPDVVITDKRRLKQILLNLLNNALKFTLKGSVTLRVAVINQVADKAMVQFDVIDTGIGIVASKLDYIFEEFAQVDESSNRQFDGSGIGLYVTKQILNVMEGTISVQSTEGEGSTFSVVLPMQLPALKKKPIEQTFNASLLQDKTVAIVDDIQSNIILLRLLLEKMGMRVTSFTDPFELIEHVLEHNPDVVLTDIDMPILSGTALCESLREHNYKGVIGAVTGHAAPQELEVIMQSPFNGYVLKPVQVDKLRGFLENALTHRGVS